MPGEAAWLGDIFLARSVGTLSSDMSPFDQMRIERCPVRDEKGRIARTLGILQWVPCPVIPVAFSQNRCGINAESATPNK